MLCLTLNIIHFLFSQRGSDELFSSVSNGPYIMSTTANGNDSKKFKGDIRGPTQPSRVIHIRKLPGDITEAEVISLGLPFGDVTNLLMLKAKNQAFLEMNSEEAAQNMVGYYSTVMPVVRHQPVYVQFSNHKELKTDNSPNQEGPGSSKGPHTVLRVVVENLLYPVTLDALCQVRRHSQKQQCNRLILLYLYNIKYYYSKLVERARDFFRGGDQRSPINHGELRDKPTNNCNNVFSTLVFRSANFIVPKKKKNKIKHFLPKGLLLLSDIKKILMFSNHLFGSYANSEELHVLCVYGDVMRVKILFNKKENALVQMSDSTQAQLAMSHLNGQRLHGSPLRITLSKHTSVQLPREGHEDQGLTKDYSNSPLHRFKKPGSKNYSNIFPPSATLHLSNIPYDHKMALIQMGSVEEAIDCLIAFHNHDLGENHHLRVSFSKSSI
uniref:Polypyrimidine tract binding protein 1 n=1 Tax=Cyprinodon variegatus TaxID=28743 RepID=A0A3Q2DGS7_CYPVA